MLLTAAGCVSPPPEDIAAPEAPGTSSSDTSPQAHVDQEPGPESSPAAIDDQVVFDALGLESIEQLFDGCFRESDVVSAGMLAGSTCLVVVNGSSHYAITNFILVDGLTEDTLQQEPLPPADVDPADYAWEELAESLLGSEPVVTTELTVTVTPEETQEVCETIRARLSELENQLAAMETKLADLQAHLAAAKAEKAALEALADDLRNKKETCPDDIAALQEQIPSLESKVESMSQALQECVSYYRECMSRHGSSSYRCNGWGDGVTAVYRRLQELKNELSATRAALESLQQACLDMDSRLHLTITPRLSELNRAIGDYEAAIATLSTEADELRGAILAAKQKYAECLEEAEELQKLEKRVEDTRKQAQESVSRAKESVQKLREEQERLKKRFPDGEYPEDLDRLEKKIEEIEDDIDAGALLKDEEQIDEARRRAEEIPSAAERERAKLRRYYLANLCLERCTQAYEIRLQVLEKRREACGASGYFEDAEKALQDLKQCCEAARTQLAAGDPSGARNACRDCLFEGDHIQAFNEALLRACQDVSSTAGGSADGEGTVDQEGLDELVDFEKNAGLQALGELGKLPGIILRAFNAGTIVGEQQKNACCALWMLKMVLSSDNRAEAEIYAYYFAHLWHEIAGLPELPVVSYNVAFRIAETVENLPGERKREAITAINSVLRGPRCAAYRGVCTG